MRWPLFRARLFFNKENKTTQERDFNWHHVFGMWSAIPLIIVVATAVVFSFSWGNTLLYFLAGETPPNRGRTAAAAETELQAPAGDRLTFDVLVAQAASAVPNWKTIALEIPQTAAAPVEINVDRGNGRQPQLREKYQFDPVSGGVLLHQALSDRTPGTQARFWVRFLHTGEAFGFTGQTVAGIVSLTSLFMVWTGFALAYRRLIVPLLRRRRVTPSTVSADSATARKPAN